MTYIVFKTTVDIPDFCKTYQFKLMFKGSFLTKPVELDLMTTLGPADLAITGLEHVPSVTQMEVSSTMHKTEVVWKQPNCVSGYKYALHHLEDCSDDEEFEDCFTDFHEGVHEDDGPVRIQLAELESCMEYVFMARSFNSYGWGDLVAQKFRTRETNSTDIDLQNFNIVGHEVDGNIHIPTLTQFTVRPGVETSTVSWRQPECFPEYELQIVEQRECVDGLVENCVRDFNPDIHDTTEEYEEIHQFTVLDPCTKYVVMGRSTADIADGAVVVASFTTKC